MKTHSKKKKTSTKNITVNKNFTVNTDFEPVKMMRDIRNKLALEIADMTFEQEKAYLEELIAKG